MQLYFMFSYRGLTKEGKHVVRSTSIYSFLDFHLFQQRIQIHQWPAYGFNPKQIYMHIFHGLPTAHLQPQASAASFSVHPYPLRIFDMFIRYVHKCEMLILKTIPSLVYSIHSIDIVTMRHNTFI